MKFLMTFLLVSFSVSALAEKGSVIPTKCLITRADGTKKELSCAEFNHKKVTLAAKIPNVCLYDNGWKIGTWNNKLSKKERFKMKYACDAGVEVYSENSDEEKIIGPRKFDPAEAEKVGQIFQSKITTVDHGGRMIEACYTQHGTKGISHKALGCDEDSTKAGYCEFIDVAITKNSGFKGKWWVRYASAGKKKPTVCRGGVILSKVEE